MLNLATLVDSGAKTNPDGIAVIFNDSKLTYTALNGMANKFANALRALGVQPGDKVCIMLPNVPFFPIAYYGILKTGAVVVPMNVLFKSREVEYYLADSEAKAFVLFDGFFEEGFKGWQAAKTCPNLIVCSADMAAPPPAQAEGVTTFGRVMAAAAPVFETVQTMADDTAVILYTSGTTGRPKGAELTHFNMFFNAVYMARFLIYATKEDVSLATLPLFHSFGQSCVMNMTFAVAGTMTLLPRFDPGAVLGIMQRDNVTVFAGVPTMYWALLNYPEADKFDLKKITANLRIAVSGGSALPLEVLRGFEARYDVPILEGYGLSETSPVASFNVLERPRKAGSIGVALWGTEMKVVNEKMEESPVGELGEIVIRGHNVMKGYYKKPEANVEAFKGGWFHTGDIARMDEDGYFFIVDRVKDMIIRGGFNVYPREIEEVLMEHPSVSLAAVVGVPDSVLGEEIKAFVVLKEGKTATAADLIDWCKERVAAYKYPRSIEFRPTLPMTATGKILKRELYGDPMPQQR
ncbi:MAG: long-chain fatty acid--CoA ligase [Anaerolineae bacterium]